MTIVSDKRLAKAVRIIMVACAVLLVMTLVWRDLALSGKLTVRHSFATPDAFVTEVVPLQRVALSEGSASITAQPVYMNLRYPRPFREATMALDFRNDDGLLVQIGPQDQSFESYDLQALDHPQLNKLFDEQHIWSSPSSAEGMRLYQKRSASYIYESIAQFATALPDKEQVGYYGVSWPKPYLPDFKARGLANAVSYNIPLRGSHEFYVATDQDSLRVEIDVQDINNTAGPDAVSLDILDWQGNVLAQTHQDDDGNVDESGAASTRHTLVAEHVGLTQPGVFLVRVSTTSDVIVRRLAVTAPYLVAKGHVSVFGGPAFASEFGAETGYPLHLVTNSRVYTAQTNHRQTSQVIQMGEEALHVEKPFETYTYRLSRGRTFSLANGYDLTLEKGNIELNGRGVFAFDRRAYFSPTPWLVDESVDIDVLNLNYIVTDYVAPVRDADTGLMRQTVHIDLRKAYAPEKSLRVQIAVPDLQPGQSVELYDAEIRYETEPLTFGNAWTKFKRFWAREIAN